MKWSKVTVGGREQKQRSEGARSWKPSAVSDLDFGHWLSSSVEHSAFRIIFPLLSLYLLSGFSIWRPRPFVRVRWFFHRLEQVPCHLIVEREGKRPWGREKAWGRYRVFRVALFRLSSIKSNSKYLRAKFRKHSIWKRLVCRRQQDFHRWYPIKMTALQTLKK